MSKKLCKLDGKNLPEKVQKALKGSEYICKKCLRVCGKEKFLCKPKKN